MRIKTLFTLSITVMLLALACEYAHAAWTWTPEIGRWINIRRQPRETAGLQFQYAEKLLTDGETEKAIDEYRKILRFFPELKPLRLAYYENYKMKETLDKIEELLISFILTF